MVLCGIVVHMGLPLIIFLLPLGMLALIPVVLVEWFVLKRDLTQYSSKHLFEAVFISNIAATLFGFPVIWVCLSLLIWIVEVVGSFIFENFFYSSIHSFETLKTVLESVILFSENETIKTFAIVLITLLLPFFFMSCNLESGIVLNCLKPGRNSKEIKQVVYKANIWSYALLLLVVVFYVLFT